MAGYVCQVRNTACLHYRAFKGNTLRVNRERWHGLGPSDIASDTKAVSRSRGSKAKSFMGARSTRTAQGERGVIDNKIEPVRPSLLASLKSGFPQNSFPPHSSRRYVSYPI